MEQKITYGNGHFEEAVRSLERWQAAERRGEPWVARQKRELDRINRAGGRPRNLSRWAEDADRRLRLLEVTAGI